MSDEDNRCKISVSIVKYILIHETKDISAIQLYNGWSNETGLAPVDFEEADWTLKFIAEIRDVDRRLLKEAYNLDSGYSLKKTKK